MLTSNTRCTEASEELTMVKPLAVPALLIRIVGWPRVDRIDAAVLDTASGEVMSQVKW